MQYGRNTVFGIGLLIGAETQQSRHQQPPIDVEDLPRDVAAAR